MLGQHHLVCVPPSVVHFEPLGNPGGPKSIKSEPWNFHQKIKVVVYERKKHDKPHTSVHMFPRSDQAVNATNLEPSIGPQARALISSQSELKTNIDTHVQVGKKNLNTFWAARQTGRSAKIKRRPVPQELNPPRPLASGRVEVWLCPLCLRICA